MSTPAGDAPALILFFGRGRGRGGRVAAKPTGSRRSSADGFAVRMKRTKAGAGLSNPVPRFRRRNGNGKNPDGQGFKSGDFFAPCAKKYYSALTVWIVGTDMERGLFSTRVCAILANGNSVNYGRQFCLELPELWNKIPWKDNPIQKWLLKGFLVYGN